VITDARERMAEHQERRLKRTKGVGGFMPWPPCPYEAVSDWEEHLHRLVGAPWPCPISDAFWRLWADVTERLEGKGFELGRGAFAGWGDGEPALVRAAWCLTPHLRPAAVVETGVARGITTRFLLETLQRNGDGHLWSIDLPPLLDKRLDAQVGAAVPEHLRAHWTYVRGSSRRRLPHLLRQLGEINLFVHDSRHSERNLLFELENAWSHLKHEGFLLADDIDLNCGFHSFLKGHPGHLSVICPAEPLRPDPGRQDDKGVFSVIQKSGSASLSNRDSKPIAR
jgi:hypothetical protein